ncbi:MAG: glucose-6-phosphate dehydrogenase [Candidatus Levybacteria bacterium]|nr:glucose-6-phosphate dehydrogenase [Candidatus Levybacteria bacterium]
MQDNLEVFKELKSPFVMIIFGATGDLAHNKLIPGLLSLFNQKMLPDDFFVIGYSRRDWSEEEFKNSFEEDQGREGWEEFSKHLYYQKGTFEEEEGYQNLIKKLNSLDEKMRACIARFFYLATPPSHYADILDKLVSTKLSEGCLPHFAEASTDAKALADRSRDKPDNGKWTRIIIEKPFGKDLETAKELDLKLSEIFEEKQIFRVDHYLGKETVQNMLAFRFANGIFEPVWNKTHIDHVQITWAQEEGIENRGNFFDGIGILRDIVQSHVMQLISAVAMEQPKSFTKDDIRNERAKVTASIRLVNDSPVIRGQYKGYKDEKGVSPDSQTETFAALKLFVDTPRFEGIPFYVRAGKKMEKEIIEISVVFIQTCHILFKEYGCPEIGNVITFRIQPDEGISLRFIAKKPGAKLALEPVNMRFHYQEGFGTSGLDAYEKILLDIFAGDQTLFSRSDEIHSSWSLLDNMLKVWKNEKNMSTYEAGSWGPEESSDLIEKDNRKWIT